MERAKGEALGRVFAVEFSFSTARSFNVLSSVTILVFFPVVPMDSISRPLRIEGLNLPGKGSIHKSMDAAPRGGHAKVIAWGASALIHDQ